MSVPDSVLADLARRDFTANALAVDLKDGSLIDPFGGVDDIRTGTLRMLSEESFREDPLRVIRALVAYGRHGLYPEDRTKNKMLEHVETIDHLPPERIQMELDKLFASDDPASAIRLAHETGVLKHILPEVDTAMGYNQNNPHHELDLGEHLLNVLDRVSQKTDDPDLRLAALLHDIGKPESAWIDPATGSSHYYYDKETGLGANHEELGSDLTRQRLNHLRYPGERINRVSDLVRGHMFSPYTTPKGARRFLNQWRDHADDLLTLRWADQGGKTRHDLNPDADVDRQRHLIEQVRQQQAPLDRSQLAIDGNDLIKAGIKPGPEIGKILNDLTQRVLDSPELNDRDTLLSLIGE